MKKIMVFSLDQKNKVASQDDIQVLESILYQSNLVPRPAFGIYKGNPEKSFIIETNTDIQVELIRAIARAYNQESILTIDAKSKEVNSEFLIENNQVKRKFLGHWFKTDKINKSGLTIDALTMNAYEIK